MSRHPLYVTSIDIDITKAKEIVSEMEGDHRMPRMVTYVDKLSRHLEASQTASVIDQDMAVVNSK